MEKARRQNSQLICLHHSMVNTLGSLCLIKVINLVGEGACDAGADKLLLKYFYCSVMQRNNKAGRRKFLLLHPTSLAFLCQAIYFVFVTMGFRLGLHITKPYFSTKINDKRKDPFF